MQITAKDLYIVGSEVSIKVLLEVDGDRQAFLILTRGVVTETGEVNVNSDFVVEGSSDFTRPEIDDLVEYTNENAAILFSRCADEARSVLEQMPKD